jgi:hypothetical protein
MKGQIEAAIAWIIIPIAITLMALLPVILLKIHIVKIIEMEFNYDNAGSALLMLLASTHDNKPVAQLLAEHILLKQPSNTDFAKNNIEKIVTCYKISTPSKTLIETTCSPEYGASAKVALPYNYEKLVESVTLMIG